MMNTLDFIVKKQETLKVSQNETTVRYGHDPDRDNQRLRLRMLQLYPHGGSFQTVHDEYGRLQKRGRLAG